MWELRDNRTLPKHLQQLGKDAKKRWQQAHARLTALASVMQCLKDPATTVKAQQKLTKALQKLHKTPTSLVAVVPVQEDVIMVS